MLDLCRLYASLLVSAINDASQASVCLHFIGFCITVTEKFGSLFFLHEVVHVCYRNPTKLLRTAKRIHS